VPLFQKVSPLIKINFAFTALSVLTFAVKPCPSATPLRDGYLYKVKGVLKGYYLTAVVLGLCCVVASAQTTEDTTVCPTKDIKDAIRKKTSLQTKPVKNYYLLVTPIIASSPATGFVVGFASQLAFKGPNPEDKYSLGSANIQYTTKNQLLINIKNSLLLSHNKWFLSGDWRLFLFSQPTYGLGTDVLRGQPGGGIVIGDELVNPDSIAEPMKYDYLKFHQTASYLVTDKIYLGGGIHIDSYSKITDDSLNLEAGDTTHHYAYSLKHDYDPTKYAIEGLSVNMIIDTRDNQLNATKGWYLNLNWRVNPKLSANQKTGAYIYAEMRHFNTFRIRRYNTTMAFWAWGTFQTGGDAPYLTLPSIGWDQRNRSGRGYTQGQFRGTGLVYGEAEYRFPLTCNQLLGGVVFVNATTASDLDRQLLLFRYIQPAFGFGLRLNMDKKTRTNLVLDYAFGTKSSGFYLNATETF
jgi:hypothetical protein